MGTKGVDCMILQPCTEKCVEALGSSEVSVLQLPSWAQAGAGVSYCKIDTLPANSCWS
jgi:hypothetical protein